MRSHRTDREIEELPVIAGHSPDHGLPPTVDEDTFPAAAGEVFRVTGMDCSEEVAAIERALKPLAGVIGVRAEIVASKVTVFHDGKLSRSIIAEAINKSGVTVQHKKELASRPSTDATLVATSGLATGLGLLLQWFGFKETWPPDAAFLAAIVTGGLVIPKALRSLRSISLDMNVLMTAAVFGAVAIGEHAEGAAVAFLFSLSELLESWSVGRARRAIEANPWRDSIQHSFLPRCQSPLSRAGHLRHDQPLARHPRRYRCNTARSDERTSAPAA
jgi:Cd2+/Zn2+-exporting ATPase